MPSIVRAVPKPLELRTVVVVFPPQILLEDTHWLSLDLNIVINLLATALQQK